MSREPGDDRLERGAPDPARLEVAVGQLSLLVAQTRHRLTGEGTIARVEDDLAVAAELGAAIAAGRGVRRTERTNFAAELMIRADGTRPASLVRGGRLLAPGQLGPFGQMFERFLPDAAASVRATGRIEREGRHLGSGVLVTHPDGGEPVVLTAAHVVEGFGCEAGRRLELSLQIDFLGEVGSVGADRHRLGRLLAIGDGAAWPTDYAILELGDSIDGLSPPPPVKVDYDRHAVEPPAQLAVVSYPGRPSGGALALWPELAWRQIFEGIWHLKRVSPARSVDGSERPLVHHDATTTEGSSGGAMLSIGSGRLGGLHLGGGAGVNVALHASVPLGVALACR